ncbi:PF06127 domain protein [Leptospira sp. serovar Kenya str. Sh9]|nr:PF06127 domain protein [Leptospira borgpetersenii str. UI 09149]EMK14379.1 PF06127 domain protein [Leptospira sp. serovar Kenya str. Sh9]
MLALGMLILSSLMIYLIVLLQGTVFPIVFGVYSYGILELSITVFILAWIGQFIGHKIEGKKPSFLKDLQFLLIGPIWLLGFIYQKLKIAY